MIHLQETHVTELVQTKKLILGKDPCKNELVAVNNILELSTVNSSFIISNKGNDDKFAVYNKLKELFVIDDKETRVNYKLRVGEEIKTQKIIAKEMHGLLMDSDQPNIKKLGILESLSVSNELRSHSITAKDINAEYINGYIKKPHQPYISSIGKLDVLYVKNFINSETGFSIGNSVITAKEDIISTKNFAAESIFATNFESNQKTVSEYFASDEEYEIGSILEFGGTYDVTLSKTPTSTNVAGVVVDKTASIILNSKNINVGKKVLLGLVGVVMCKISGQARKGSLLVSAGDGTAKVDFDPKPGTIIGKSLEDFYGTTGVILVKLMSA